jgi:hypothetical protein
MGFLSGIFGGAADWDGANYVAKLSGSKFWHKNFIDKDQMRRAGVAIAVELDPLNMAPREPQSIKTIVGELIYLLETCETQNDKAGARNVARAIQHLLSNNGDGLPVFADMKLITTSYQDYL